MNLDNIDIKILNILQRNSREPLKSIAQQCFISAPSASSRIQKLEKEIIKNYRLVINYEKLGYQATGSLTHINEKMDWDTGNWLHEDLYAHTPHAQE